MALSTVYREREGWRCLPRALAVLLTASPLLACTQDQPPPSFSTTDSAGVVIVQNRGDLAPGRLLAEAPSLVIGTADGDENDQLFQVAGIRRLSDGRIGVVNAGTHQVRFYLPDGTFQTGYGRRGGGPEEFQMPALAGSVGDTLIVVDRAHHRLSFVHPDQGIVGLARVSDEVGGFLNPVGSFRNGQTVFGGAFDMRRMGELKNGMNRAGTFYRSAKLDGTLSADFGDKDGAEFFIRDLESDGPDARPALIPFARVPVGAVSPRFFFFSSQDHYEVEVFDQTGTLIRLIRHDHRPLPVTSADAEAHIEGVVAQVDSPDQEAGIRAQLGSLPLPEAFPPLGSILADDLDHLWVQDFQRPGIENRTWTVFDPEGVMVDRIVLPTRFNPTHIGPDFVLGLGWDEMNVEYIRMYPLTR